MTAPNFWLGPLGRLVPLSSPERDIERSMEMSGASNTSLDGTTTLDIRGFRRTWKLATTYLDVNDLSYLQACYQGLVSGPLRLIDPINKNRLSASTSAATKASEFPGGRTNWYSAGGSVLSSYGSTPDIAYTRYDGTAVTYSPDTYISWNAPAAGTLSAEVSGSKPLNTKAVPARVGEVLTLSLYLRVASGGGTGTAYLRAVDASGAVVGTASASTSLTVWTPLSATLTVPATAVGVVVQFGSTLEGAYEVCQLQVEEGNAPTPWVAGQGCPEVAFLGLEEVSPRYPQVSCALTLKEV